MPLPVILLLLPAVLLACSTPVNQDKELTTVRVGTTSFLGEAATFVASEKGFFKDEGLHIILHVNESGRASLLQLIEEEAEIAHVAETPVAYALLDSSYFPNMHSPAIRIFADMMYSNIIQRIIVSEQSGINEPAELSGKSIGILRGTQSDYHLSSFLLENGLTTNDVTLVDLPPSEQIRQLKKGEIDAMVSWEPYVTQVLMNESINAHELKSRLTYSTVWLAVSRAGYAKENQKVLVSYLKALKKAQGYIRQNPESARAILAEKTGAPEEVLQEVWSQVIYSLSLSERMLYLLDEQARWMENKGIAKQSTYDFTENIFFKPMEIAEPSGITIIR